MSAATLGRRVARVEAVVHGREQRRFSAACDAVKRDLSEEQKAVVRAWFNRADPDPETPCSAPHQRRDFCERCIEAVDPPPLVRAMWTLVMWHMHEGSPALLPPEVARVYLDDPDAWPLRRCVACGYRLPMRAKLRRDRTFREIGSYEGVCPSCGTDGREGNEDAT